MQNKEYLLRNCELKGDSMSTHNGPALHALCSRQVTAGDVISGGNEQTTAIYLTVNIYLASYNNLQDNMKKVLLRRRRRTATSELSQSAFYHVEIKIN